MLGIATVQKQRNKTRAAVGIEQDEKLEAHCYFFAFQVDRISAVKCNILRNDEKTQKMLSSISFASR